MLAAAVLVAGAAAACSSAGSGAAGPSADLQRLIRKADLQPCPATSPGSVPGGLPHLVLRCIATGPPVNLAGLRGKPTVVDIYGSWCQPCQREAGYLSTVASSSAGRVRFLGVDFQDYDDSALDFAAHVRPPARYPLVATDDAALILQFTSAGPPVAVFVDSAGKVVGHHVGEYFSARQLRGDIRRYLGVTA